MDSGFCGMDECLKPIHTIVTFANGDVPLPLCEYHIARLQERARAAGLPRMEVEAIADVKLTRNNARDGMV